MVCEKCLCHHVCSRIKTQTSAALLPRYGLEAAVRRELHQGPQWPFATFLESKEPQLLHLAHFDNKGDTGHSLLSAAEAMRRLRPSQSVANGPCRLLWTVLRTAVPEPLVFIFQMFNSD